MKTIKFKRGDEARRSQVQAKEGEPIWVKDTKELWIGDGTTFGGQPVGTVKPKATVTAGNIAVFDDATGKVLGESSKADLLTGMASEQYVRDTITADVPSIKVDSAKVADTATSASQLEGKRADDFVAKTSITSSYQEDDSNKVVSAAGVKKLSEDSSKNLSDGLALKVDKASISNDISLSDDDKVASMEALAKLKTAIEQATATQAALDQLTQDLTTQINNVSEVPLGGTMLWSLGVDTVPATYIILDGREVTRQDYPDLVTLIAGPHATKATVPDWSNRYVRQMSSTLPPKTLQENSIKAHRHTGTTDSYDYGTKNTDYDNAHHQTVKAVKVDRSAGIDQGDFILNKAGLPQEGLVSNEELHRHSVYIGYHDHKFTTGSTGDSETRPDTVVGIYIMKAIV